MIYVIDLDHTLCDTKKKPNGDWDYLNSIPYENRIKKVNLLWEKGNKIIIETARGCNSKRNWYLETYNQLVSWGLKFHQLRTGVKFGADYYIDDKAINSEDFFRE
jgi:hypothetical protein|tara:strand:- start:361 stop:675 length:315 start_codon:yes stop_codon:yes gene_type:complete